MTTASKPFGEGAAVEEPAIALFRDMGWDHIKAYYEKFGAEGDLGRESKREVFLTRYLRRALERLNPTLPAYAIDEAVTEVRALGFSPAEAREGQSP